MCIELTVTCDCYPLTLASFTHFIRLRDCLSRMSEEYSSTLERAEENSACKAELDGMFSDLEDSRSQLMDVEDQVVRLQEVAEAKDMEMKQLTVEYDSRIAEYENQLQLVQNNSDNGNDFKTEIDRLSAALLVSQSSLEELNAKIIPLELKLTEKESLLKEKEEEYNDLVGSLLTLEKGKEEEKVDFENHIGLLVDEIENLKLQIGSNQDGEDKDLQRTQMMAANEILMDQTIELLKNELRTATEKASQMTSEYTALAEENMSLVQECDASKADKETIEDLTTANMLLTTKMSDLQHQLLLKVRESESSTQSNRSDLEKAVSSAGKRERERCEEMDMHKELNSDLTLRVRHLEELLERQEMQISLLTSPPPGPGPVEGSNSTVAKTETDICAIAVTATTSESQETTVNSCDTLSSPANPVSLPLIHETFADETSILLTARTEEVQRLSVILLENENRIQLQSVTIFEKAAEMECLKEKHDEMSIRYAESEESLKVFQQERGVLQERISILSGKLSVSFCTYFITILSVSLLLLVSTVTVFY